MSIFELALRDDFARLHPRMRERLSLDAADDRVCVATGVMNRIWHGPAWQTPFLRLAAAERLLIPEAGEDIPFTMVNRPFRDSEGREGITYDRMFDFGTRIRRFDSATVYDPSARKLVDLLGTHRLVAADWHIEVDRRGGLVIHGGRQRIGAGRVRIPIPSLAGVDARVHDWFDPDIERFRIDVRLTHPKLGTVLGYQGVFTCRFEATG